MKKISVVFLLTTLFSCNSDDSSSNNSLIVGEWNYVERNINGVDSGFEEICQFEEYQIYTNDGIYEHIEFDNPTDAICVQIESTIADWSINSTNLTITYGSSSVTAEIVELNSTTLKYKISNQDVNEDDIADIVIYTLSRRN